MKQLYPVCYGDIIKIFGRKAYIVGVDDKGSPNAFLSVYARRCFSEDFEKIKFSNNWHIPSNKFYEKYHEGICVTAKRYNLDKCDWITMPFPVSGGAYYVRWSAGRGYYQSFYNEHYHGEDDEYNYARACIEI